MTLKTALVLGFCLAALSAGSALAQDKRCYFSIDLNALDADPQLMQVGGEGRAYFLQDGDLCPAAGESCKTSAYLMPGDFAVVTQVREGVACAGFTGGAPKFAATTNWLDASRLTTAASDYAGAQSWVGEWQSGPEQRISIKAGPEGSLQIEGNATWASPDPELAANGAVHVGNFEAEIMPEGRELFFSIGETGKALPWQSEEDSPDCSVRLWLRGPFLVAQANRYCGGANVSFNGVYAK